jgi:hypothetical protein
MKDYFAGFDVVGWILGGCLTLCCACLFAAFGFLMFAGWQHFDALSLKKGAVIEKSYSPAHSSTVMMNYGTPQAPIMMPLTTDYPESWRVTIEGYDPKGKFKKRTVSVSKSTFDSVREGFEFSAD